MVCTDRVCIDPCQDEPDTEPGDCLRALPIRYYYDAGTGVCLNYSRGCGADSRNDFATAEDCYTRCKPNSKCVGGENYCARELLLVKLLVINALLKCVKSLER